MAGRSARANFFETSEDEHDNDTESQLSISLSSAPPSPPPEPVSPLPKASPVPKPTGHFQHVMLTDDLSPEPYIISDDPAGSDAESAPPTTATTSFDDDLKTGRSSVTSVSPNLSPGRDLPKAMAGMEQYAPVTYPPMPFSLSPKGGGDYDVQSIASQSSKKARPESQIIVPPSGPLILGIALVDFNHLVSGHWITSPFPADFTLAVRLDLRSNSPKGISLTTRRLLEYFHSWLCQTALIWCVHSLCLCWASLTCTQSAEDYSYFHVVPSSPNPSTVFGISSVHVTHASWDAS